MVLMVVVVVEVEDIMVVEEGLAFLEAEVVRATPCPLTISRRTVKACNRAMACYTSRTPLANQATTFRALLASLVLLEPTILLLIAHPLRLASHVVLENFHCKALPLAPVRVQAARQI